jgi:hypothetical protein
MSQTHAPSPPASPNLPPQDASPVYASGLGQRARADDPEPDATGAPISGADDLPFHTPPGPAHGMVAARTALTAGDGLAKPAYDPGMTPVIEVPALTVPVLARPVDTAMPLLGTGVTLRPASEMDSVQAASTLATITANAKAWMANFPHAVQGEGAHVLAFFRGLAAHQRLRADATVNGQRLPDDPVEAAKHAPPPEAFALRDLITQARNVMRIYQKAMSVSNVNLAPGDNDAITAFEQALTRVRPDLGAQNTTPLDPGMPNDDMQGINQAGTVDATGAIQNSSSLGGFGTSTPSRPGRPGTTSTNQPAGPGSLIIANPEISGAPPPGRVAGSGTIISPPV